MRSEIRIKNVYPEIEGGRFPVKREVDRSFRVTADIYSKEPPEACLLYRKKHPNSSPWFRVPMIQEGEVRWSGAFPMKDMLGWCQYTVEANLKTDKNKKTTYTHVLEIMVEPVSARFAAWYEMFHRSQGRVPGKSATFDDMIARLFDIKRMGFDVIYLPPIHPIGRTNRKGPNNSLKAGHTDPGSPWSVGNECGGHKAINPELGTLDDFKRFVRACRERGMEVALDFTTNCSPDHPWIKKHPNWFFRNPDGSIKYAENPPKKYEDVCPLNLMPGDREELWNEIKGILTFWLDQGVTAFRIDNPHTKPQEFWEWIIREVTKDYPGTVFLSEAFTDYDKLESLSRLGFSQSYTYFTWRNAKNELIEYLLKLTNSYLKEFLRPNFFVNTPDIHPPILFTGGRPAFKMRIALAATSSSLYGMYNGYEVLENDKLPDKDELRNSEKYEYKVRNWDAPGNIKGYIARLNHIRRENPALHYTDNLRIYNSTCDSVLFYGKTSPDGRNTIFVAINLDPFRPATSRITVPVEEFGISSDEEYEVRELITDSLHTWRGRENYITLDPNVEPAAIFRCEKRPVTL
jgi:starch synthase (maltosyl-transferring)